MKEKKSFLTLAEISLSGMSLLNVTRNYKITSRLNKILFLAFLLFNTSGYCCVSCNKEIQQALHDSVYTNIFILFSAFTALTLVILLLIYLSLKKYNTPLKAIPSTIPLISAAMVLGIGLGGFADGIIFHQILQWHGMLSNKFPPDTLVQKSVNMFWDGIFHLFTLLTTAVGIYLLWKAHQRIPINTSGFILTGGILAGWGIFNLIEGTINHQILELHHVIEAATNKEFWDYGFLLFGTVLVLTGWLMVRRNTIYKEDNL
jgi:uncharacterized membrane protein